MAIQEIEEVFQTEDVEKEDMLFVRPTVGM